MNSTINRAIAALAFLPAIAFGLAGVEPVALAETRVIVVRAFKACFSAEVRITGFLVARAEALVNLDAEGYRVSEVLAREGDRVKEGQDLARLARQGNEGGTPPAGAGPAAMTLKAPAAGLVIKSTAVVGAVASPRAAPLFRIAVKGEIELEAEVPSVHVAMLAPKQPARVEIEDGRELFGQVRLVAGEINQTTQLGRARIALEADPSLRVGRFARATIDATPIAAKRNCGVSVPQAAVRWRTEGPSVQVVRARVIETRSVRTGLLSDVDIEILEGLADDDIVVANAGTMLHDGDQVTPQFRDENN